MKKINYISAVVMGIGGMLLSKHGIRIDSLLFWFIILVGSAICNSVETLMKEYFK